MKDSKIIVVITLIGFFALGCFVADASAQTPRPSPLPKCTANADQIYFVASGQQVNDVHPGGNGYQLNILGKGANKFGLVKDDYMESVSLIANYTNDTAAKWQVNFKPNMGREITTVRMRSECTGRAVNTYNLTVNVVLRDQ
ncbi:MAG: hypothetical protein IT173_12770 [Acidobacteria bacterium]|nr:hypothetical protein [Acidobacteriota bacterium]